MKTKNEKQVKPTKPNDNKKHLKKSGTSTTIKKSKEPVKKEVKKKAVDEIDSIFGSKPKKEKAKAAEPTQPKLQPKVDDEDDDFFDSRGVKSSRTTEEGYSIFTSEELKIGDGGDTELCPFECKCCY